MTKSRIKFGALLAVMLIVSMALVPAVSAKNELNTIQKPSEFEQGLIDALNSKKVGTSIDDVILNYTKLNSDKIKSKDDSNLKQDLSLIDTDRTYELKNRMTVTFTDGDFFYVTEMKEDNNTYVKPSKIQKLDTTQTIEIKSMSYTPTYTYSGSGYNLFGTKVFTVYTKGYFGYDGSSVEAHHIDSWYTVGTLTMWQVSNWEEGGYNHASGTTAEFYGRGNFHWGIEYDGIGLVVQDKYVNVYVKGDENGNYYGVTSIT